MTQQFFNNFETTLSAELTSGSLSMTLTDAAGLPVTLGAGNCYLLTLNDGPVETLWEILLIEADRTGNVIPISARAQEGGADLTWAIGTRVTARVTAETMDNSLGGGGGGGGDGSSLVQSREMITLNGEVSFGVDTYFGFSQDGGLSWSATGRSGFQALTGGSPDLPTFAEGVGKAGMDTAVCIESSILN